MKVKRLIVTAIRRLLANALQNAVGTSQISQRQLNFHYRNLARQGVALPDFRDTGFRVYSQNDEDGLLLHIFALIGAINRICVEIAFGSPHGSNTANLICNWGWTGLLIESEAGLAKEAMRFFRSHPDTVIYPPRVVEAWVTAENINRLLLENGISGDIDLFSLDIDGMDYWVWKALDVVRPRVVIAEILDFWGPEHAVTVPYDPSFSRKAGHPDHFGASLAAFVKLGKEKGYRLVGCNKYGFNAFFMREDVGAEYFPEVSADECLQHPKAKQGHMQRLPMVKDLPWVEV